MVVYVDLETQSLLFYFNLTVIHNKRTKTSDILIEV